MPEANPTPVRVKSGPTLNEGLAVLGKLQAEKDRLTRIRDQRVAEVEARYAVAISDLQAAIEEQTRRLRDYIAKNRERLLGDGNKAVIEAGEIYVRKLPMRVEVTDAEIAIVNLSNRNLDAYLRTTVALDKVALKKDQPNVPGIAYVEGEQLELKPSACTTKVTTEL